MPTPPHHLLLTDDKLRKVAKLAKIKLPEADIPTLRNDLNAVLGWILQLEEVDVSGVAPLTGAADMALRLRDDVVTDGNQRDAHGRLLVLGNAPDLVNDLYAVPRFIE